MPPADFKCKQCGNCCLNLNAHYSNASMEDVRRWEAAGREDILQWVDCTHDIWIHPETGDDVYRCPWLRKVRGKDRYHCRIYDLRPDICRNYPLTRQHAENTGCPGFD